MRQVERPVAVTGAGGWIGNALVEALAARGVDVRPLRRGDDLAAGLRGAVAAVLLAGAIRPRAPDTFEEANYGTVVRALDAMDDSVERVVLLSALRADRFSHNLYLRAKGLAEAAVEASGRHAVVIRCGHVYGPRSDPGPFASAHLARAGVVTVLGGPQRVAPVYRGDVVAALAHAAVAPDVAAGTYALVGPEATTLEEFVRALNGRRVRVRRIPPALGRILGRVAPRLNPAIVDVVLADSVADPAPAAAALGLQPRRVSDVYP